MLPSYASFSDVLRDTYSRSLKCGPVSSESEDKDILYISAYRSFVRLNHLKSKCADVPNEKSIDIVRKATERQLSMSNEDFRAVADRLPSHWKKYFTAKNFLLFPMDKYSRIETADFLRSLLHGKFLALSQFLRFLERFQEVELIMLHLMEFQSPGGDPYSTTITVSELETFILRLVPEIDMARKMHESFYEFYVYTAVQKFLFFLDPRKTNTISIKKLAHSTVMEELLHLRRLSKELNLADSHDLDLHVSIWRCIV